MFAKEHLAFWHIRIARGHTPQCGGGRRGRQRLGGGGGTGDICNSVNQKNLKRLLFTLSGF